MKNRQVKPRRQKKKKCLMMVCADYYAPKEDEDKPDGEDAHFISSEKQTIGVADGVSKWWSRYGIDAGEYARELMVNAVSALDKEAPAAGIDPKRVLCDAFSVTESEGSSTACIVSHKDGVIRAANVGDSHFIVFRKDKIVYRSPIQQRRFNCPYQLGNSEKSDKPKCAVQISFPVVEGDVIILGTDGFFDNIFEKEAEAALEKNGDLEPDELAKYIGELALSNSLNWSDDSPFSEEAKRAGKNFSGGKEDDSTVIVGKIVRNY